MTARLSIIIVVGMLLSIIYFFGLVSKNRLGYKYAFYWAILALCVSTLALFPQLLNLMADAMGIASPVNGLFYLGIFFLLFVVFSLSISISRLTDKVRRLTQDLGILRKEVNDQIEEMEKKNEERKEEKEEKEENKD